MPGCSHNKTAALLSTTTATTAAATTTTAYLGVGALHAVHGVVEHGEVFPCEKGLDGREVEDGLEQLHVLLGGGHLFTPPKAVCFEGSYLGVDFAQVAWFGTIVSICVRAHKMRIYIF